MEFLGEFFYGVDIDIHQLNLGKFRNLKYLDEIPFKKCVFKNNESIIISLVFRNNHYHIKDKEIL
jgi:hypothetical protein